jgi:hypothetical protein
MTFKIDQLIGVFPHAVSTDICEKLIAHFNQMDKFKGTYNRQESDGANISDKNDKQLYMGEDMGEERLICNGGFINGLADIIHGCMGVYADNVYGLKELDKQLQLLPFKIQKTLPGQGYHIWHHEQSTMIESHRIISIIVYLNNVEEGGETEFIHQRRRLPPKQGTVVIFPSSYTHTHRGNPPISGEKFIVASWFALTK